MIIVDWLLGVTERGKRIAAEEQHKTRAGGDWYVAKLRNEIDDLKADLAAKTKAHEETLAELIETKRRYGDLDRGFEELARVFRRSVDDLIAAGQLLDEAGERIDTLNVTLRVVDKKRVEYIDRLAEVMRAARG